jgi:hypothetical protein
MGMRGEMVDAWKKHWAKENGQNEGERWRNVPRKRKKLELRNEKICVCKCRCCGANENGQIGIEKSTQTEEELVEKMMELDNIEKEMLDVSLLNKFSMTFKGIESGKSHFGQSNSHGTTFWPIQFNVD